ncbi:ester cyclase [Geodermatophilus sp. SYSU D00691]
MSLSEKHRRQHELFNDRDFDGLDQLIRDDVTYEDVPQGLTVKNLEEFKDWVRGWTAAFSDMRIEDASYQEGPGFCLARVRGRGLNDGVLGPMPATGRRVDMPYWELLNYDAEGRVVSGAVVYDQVTMLTQLGVLPAPG